MNEKAIQAVISEYAMEVANLRLTVATLAGKVEELKEDNSKEGVK